MKASRIVAAFVLVDFLALTAYTVAQVGYAGFFELANANWATRLLFVDLTIALSLILVWMFRDARERGARFAPYALVTLFFGAAGPLLYFASRTDAPVRTST